MSAESICPECKAGQHVACRDEPGTSADCACPCGEHRWAITDTGAVCTDCGEGEPRSAAPGYGSAQDETFVRAWLAERDRPGFYMRAGQPWVDWEAWARGIREGWITEEGYWNGD